MQSGDPAELVLNVGRTCEDIGLAIADPDVLPSSTIHAAALARSDEDTTWYLASADPGELALRRVPKDIFGVDLSVRRRAA